VGGGGGGFYRPRKADQAALDRAREQEHERLITTVNEYLRSLLPVLSDDSVHLRQERLETLRDALGAELELEGLLLAGSVSKHTSVTGISDVDALLILDSAAHADDAPATLREMIAKRLRRRLPRESVSSITSGSLAVTIVYADGPEIQLLPCLRSKGAIFVPSEGGAAWVKTKPKVFTQRLSRANERVNYALVPAIKLMKVLVDRFPVQRQLSGYHIEALALDAMSGYAGPGQPRAVLLHVLDHASRRVLRPIADPTEQSTSIDASLGPASGPRRINVAQALDTVRRRLASATSVSQWRATFGEVD